MTIDHAALAVELEAKFADRFTEKDEDYARSLKFKFVDPPCIYPYFNHQNKRRGGYNNQFNHNQFSHKSSSEEHKRRRYD